MSAASLRTSHRDIFDIAFLLDSDSVVSTSPPRRRSSAGGSSRPLPGRGEDNVWDPSVRLMLGEYVYALEFRYSYKYLCCIRVGKKETNVLFLETSHWCSIITHLQQ